MPATAHELSRAGLLAHLPGARLADLAVRMTREEVAPGVTVVREGDVGERFYVVLSGMLDVTQASYGRRGVLKPGDHFGEVALAVGVPRTATVRSITPATLASCDRETFDAFIRPLFADGEADADADAGSEA